MSTLNIYNLLKLITYSLIILNFTTQISYGASLNLAWDANSEGDLGGYKLYYGTSSSNYGTHIDIGNFTEYELSGLNEDTTYYIALTAYDTSYNESEKSDEVSGVAQLPPDTQNPTITITSPTSSTTYSTSNSIINIGGTASDNVGVNSVTWSNNRGDSGSASGTINWYVSTITLQEGENIITVTVRDDAGNTSTDIIIIIYTTPTTSTTTTVSSTTTTTATSTLIIEAEEMSYHANGAQQGEYWLLWTNGTMSEDVYFSNTDVYRFEIIAKGDLAYGVGPEMELLIDGEIKDTVFVSTITPETFSFDVEISQGTYGFAIGFHNDFYSPSEGIDRNLYVDKTTITPVLENVTTTTTTPSTTTTVASTTTTTTITLPEYTLTVNIVGSGNVTFDPDGGTYDEGAPVTLTAEADSGWVFSGWSGDLTGSDNPVTITMNSDKSVTATLKEDFDNDGISDEEEDTGPNGGDGNHDLILDSEQDNVASFPTYDNQDYVTLASPDTTTLSDVKAIDNPSPTDAPAGTEFPYGFFEFNIEGVEFGGATTVTLFLPNGTTSATYYKYGPTPDNPIPHWYNFMFDGQTGAEINGNVVILYFIDGQRGDDDLTANGTIVEPGGPGKMVTPPTTTTTTPVTTTTPSTTTIPITTTTPPTTTTPATTTISPDDIPPTGTIIINNGDEVTHSPNVILTLFAADDGEELGEDELMSFSNDNQEWSDSEPYTTTKMWSLSPGEGDKTVFVKFRDAAGNWMIEPAKDQIRFEESPDICDDPYKLQPASIAASSEFLPFRAKDKVADGNLFSFWSTGFKLFWKNEFITLDLGEIKKVSRIDMYALKFFTIDFFPVNFQIQVSRDNIKWEEVCTEQNYIFRSANTDSWDLNNSEAQYIRVYINKAKTFFIFYVAQIAEIEVYGCDIPEQNLTSLDDTSSIKDGELKDNIQEEVGKSAELEQGSPSVPGRPVITFN